MEETQITSFVVWSVVTGIVMVVTGLSYTVFLKRKNHNLSST
jgi:hypothetical protein